METGIDSLAAKIWDTRATGDARSLPHDTLMNCIGLIGQRIVPLLRG